MYPELFHICGFSQHLRRAGGAGFPGRRCGWPARLARRAGLNRDAVTNLGIYCALAAIVGAKVMMFLVDIPYYARNPGEIFSLATLQAGGVFYGGLIAARWRSPGGTCAARICRRCGPPMCSRRASRWATASAGWAAFPRAAAGACECHAALGRHLHQPGRQRAGGRAARTSPLHPTQLYESAAEFLIFGILYWRIRKPHAPGAIISLYLMLYSHSAFRGGVLPLPRAGQSLRRPARIPRSGFRWRCSLWARHTGCAPGSASRWSRPRRSSCCSS